VSIHNNVMAEVGCPQCGRSAVQQIEGWFGDRNLYEYTVGDRVKWVPRRAPQNGGRPELGTAEAEGYFVCEGCGADWFVKISIAKDVIAGIEIDESRAGYIPR